MQFEDCCIGSCWLTADAGERFSLTTNVCCERSLNVLTVLNECVSGCIEPCFYACRRTFFNPSMSFILSHREFNGVFRFLFWNRSRLGVLMSLSCKRTLKSRTGGNRSSGCSRGCGCIFCHRAHHHHQQQWLLLNGEEKKDIMHSATVHSRPHPHPPGQ